MLYFQGTDRAPKKEYLQEDDVYEANKRSV
jgi:hypothetical protein